ncbi:MAG: beta-phosphoglucomutase [Phototrophicaceae bacterium]
MTQNTVNALIFDLDGVLVDTMRIHFQAWEALAEDHQLPFDQAMKDSFRGLPQSKCIKRLFANQALSETDTHKILQQKNDTYQAIIHDTPPNKLLVDGVLKFLESARNINLKLGIASSSVSADMVIQHTGLNNYVDVVANGLTVNNGKPATDIFVWVAGALRTLPSHCIVFEDGLVGLQAARQAGMFSVGIGTGYWLAENANWQFSDMKSIQLKHLLEQVIEHNKEAI